MTTTSSSPDEWLHWFNTLLSSSSTASPTEKSEFLSVDPLSSGELLTRVQHLLNSLRQTGNDFASPTQSQQLGLLGDALTNYLAKNVDPDSYDKLNHIINAATIHWLHAFLRLPAGVHCCYRSSKERARLQLSKTALIRAFPSFPSEGYLSFGKHIPVILASYPWTWLDGLRYDLGLPADSVKIFGDENSLAKFLNSSISTLRPFLIIASAGGPLEGNYHTDDIKKLAEISEKFNLWLHVEGSGMLAISGSISENPDFSGAYWNGIGKANSVLFNALNLLGYDDRNKAIPTIFYKHETSETPTTKTTTTLSPAIVSTTSTTTAHTTQNSQSTISTAATTITSSAPSLLQSTISASSSSSPSSASSVSSTLRPADHGFLTFQLWLELQFRGLPNLRKEISKSVQLSEQLHSELCQIKDGIEIKSPKYANFVIFRFKPSLKHLQSSFIDKINEQIFRDINQQENVAALDLELVNVSCDKYTVDSANSEEHFFCFNPLYSPNFPFMDSSHVTAFSSSFALMISLLTSTLSSSTTFYNVLSHHKYISSGIVYMHDHVEDFVGLGSVRYIPPILCANLPVILTYNAHLRAQQGKTLTNNSSMTSPTTLTTATNSSTTMTTTTTLTTTANSSTTMTTTTLTTTTNSSTTTTTTTTLTTTTNSSTTTAATPTTTTNLGKTTATLASSTTSTTTPITIPKTIPKTIPITTPTPKNPLTTSTTATTTTLISPSTTTQKISPNSTSSTTTATTTSTTPTIPTIGTATVAIIEPAATNASPSETATTITTAAPVSTVADNNPVEGYVPPDGHVPPEFMVQFEEQARKFVGKALKDEVNQLNLKITEKLAEIDPIFQKVNDKYGNVCIGIGVDAQIISEKRIAELARIIVETCHLVEASFNFTDQMGKILSDGIRQAEERLKRENERLELQQGQGFISYIPIVGSVWNYWWASPQKNPTHSGNGIASQSTVTSFNLISSEFIEKQN